MSNRMWLLGAPDPEMEAIERLLREVGEAVEYATTEGGMMNMILALITAPILVLSVIIGCRWIDRRLDRRYARLIAEDRARWEAYVADHYARQDARRAFEPAYRALELDALVARLGVEGIATHTRRRLCRPVT